MYVPVACACCNQQGHQQEGCDTSMCSFQHCPISAWTKQALCTHIDASLTLSKGWVKAIFAGPDPDPVKFRSELIFILFYFILFFSNALILIFWLTFMYLLNSSVNYYLFTIKIEPLDLH